MSNDSVRVLAARSVDISTYGSAVSGTTVWATGGRTAPATYMDSNGHDALERRFVVMDRTVTLTNANWTVATKSLTKTGAFVNYRWSHLDRIQITAGAGATTGAYTIASRVSDDEITLTANVAAGNLSGADIAGTIYLSCESVEAFLNDRDFTDQGYVDFKLWGAAFGEASIGATTGATWYEGNRTIAIPVVGANWTDATKSIVLTGAFAGYTLNRLDAITLTAGTGVTTGTYTVATRTSDDAITTSADINGGGGDIADNTINGTLWMWSDTPQGVLFKTAAFASYTHAPGDVVLITSGTGARIGYYEVAGKIDSNQILLRGGPGLGANGQTDIAFTLLTTNQLTVKLYQAQMDGSSPTNMMTWVMPYFVCPVGTGNFEMNVRVAVSGGGETVNSTVISCECLCSLNSTTSTQYTTNYQFMTRGTTNLKQNARYYLSYQKGATSTKLDFSPRGITISHVSPKAY